MVAFFSECVGFRNCEDPYIKCLAIATVGMNNMHIGIGWQSAYRTSEEFYQEQEATDSSE